MLIIILSDVLCIKYTISGVLSHLDSGEGSPVLISAVCLQLAVSAHHLTLVAEPKFGLWLFQDGDVRPIMVNG